MTDGSPRDRHGPDFVTGETVQAPAPRLGRRLGEYRLDSELGHGGMGVVYRAEHTRLGRTAAVKVIHPDLAKEPGVIKRFLSEAMIVARLQHPNIVDVYDVGETPEPYCVMELLAGRSLSAALAEGPMPEPRIRAIARQILLALDVVHGRGIVHRDIKPDNVFLVSDGVHDDHVKLLDFGIAKLLEGQALGHTSTAAGTLVGTPYYMAPEQIEGQPVDARADLYALGVILYQMATGRRPFEAPTLASLLSKQLLELPPRPLSVRPDLSPALDAVIMGCLAKRREARYPSAAAVLQALDSGAPAAAVTASFGTRRRPLWLAAAGALLVVLALLVIVLSRRSERSRGKPAAPDLAPTPPRAAAPDLRHLDTAAELDRAGEKARQIAPDALLVLETMYDVRPDGSVDASAEGGGVLQFGYRSPARSRKDYPRRGMCLVTVIVKAGSEQAYEGSGTCDQQLIDPPRCTAAAIWGRALADGADPKGHVDLELYARKGKPVWELVDIDSKFRRQYPDDCR